LLEVAAAAALVPLAVAEADLPAEPEADLEVVAAPEPEVIAAAPARVAELTVDVAEGCETN